MPNKKICQALQNAYQKLQKSNIKSAHLDAEILLSHILEKPREYVLAHSEKMLTTNQVSKFNILIKKRAQHVPVAYIANQKEFYGWKFYIDERVLIPRPETEMMVGEIIRRPMSPLDVGRLNIIVDIGTGSGCIAITLAKELRKNKNTKFIATDISSPALTVARKNARLHNVNKKITFLHGNLLEPVIKKLEIRNSSLVICANLPYLIPAQIKNSPSIKYEPKIALSAGKDGLKYYRQLFLQIKQLKKLHPKLPITLFCEIDYTQITSMKQLIKYHLPNSKTQIKKDLSGHNRLVIIDLRSFV